MARDVNKTVHIGRLGADPELRYTATGTPVANFRLAVNRRVRQGEGGEGREETDWFSVVAWQKLAETCANHLKKGSRVYIEGRLQNRSWEDQSGQKRYATEIVASDLVMLDTREQSGGRRVEETPPLDDADYPF